MKSVKSIVVDNVRHEVKRRLSAMGFKIIDKSSRKFYAIKPITKEEIASIVKQITTLLECADLDGGIIRPVLKFSYALLNENSHGAAGISIAI